MPNVSVGDKITLKTKAQGGVGKLSYQWYKDGSSDEIITGATEDTLTISKKEQKMEYYHCEVQDEKGTSSSTIFYIPAVHTLTITQYINEEKTSSVEAIENERVSMRIDAESAAEEPSITYNWCNEKTGGLGYYENTLTITKSDVNEIYFCDVNDGVSTERVYFYVNLKGTVTIAKRTCIIGDTTYDMEQNSLPNVPAGTEITLQVEAESSVGDIKGYQWYHWEKGENDEYEDFKKIPGETSDTLKVKKSKVGREQYYCEVSDAKSSKNADFYIPAAKTLTVTQSINDEEDCTYYTTTKGTSVTMKVNATSTVGNDQITYQWYDSSNNPIKGANKATYTVEKGLGSESYSCFIQDPVNDTTLFFTLETENTISSVKTYINDRQENSMDNAKVGKTYTLKVEPVSKNKDATYTYSWYTYNKNGKREDIEEDGPELEVTTTKDNYVNYYVDITSDDGSVSNANFSLYKKSDLDLSILAYVNDEYVSFSDDGCLYYTVDSDKESKLYVDAKEASGKDITYQWNKGSEENGNMESIEGATDATYTAAALESDREVYTCTITCDGESRDCVFYLNKKNGSTDRRDPDVSKYVFVNGVKVEYSDYDIYVDKGDKVTLGVKVSDLPEGIKEDDISYEWYERTEDDDPAEDGDIICKDKECTISSISAYTMYKCRLMIDGKRLINWDVEFYIYINPDITTEISVNGEKLGAHDSWFGVDSFEELYNKKVTIKATDKTNPGAKFNYEWFKTDEDGEKVESISTTSECVLTKEILSEDEVYLRCVITDEEGNTQQAGLSLYVYDYSDSASKYINGEETNSGGEGQFKEGDKVTLKVAFLDDIANKMKYQWYDDDWKKMDCQKAECTVTKGEGEENYTCIVTDQYNRTMSYDFTLYPETKLLPQRYLNGKKVNSLYNIVRPGSTVNMEIKVNSGDDVTYQWYGGETKKLKGETKANLSVKASEESGKEDDYSCLVTRGNERTWVYFWVVSCDHSDTETLPAVPATCEKDGLKEGKRCKDCGEILEKQEVIKATGHKWDNGTITKPATETETGVKTFTCTVCKKTKTEVIPKLTTNNTTNNNVTNNTTTKKPETTEASLKTGTKVTDKKSKAVYKVVGNRTVQYTKASNKKAKKAKKVKVPATVTVNGVKYQVTAIAPNAFKNNKNLKTVVIPASVRSIGKQAFAGCKNLKTITIKTPYLTKKSVGAKAFKGISAKAVIKVPKKQLKAYKKLLKTKGVTKSMKIK